MHIPVVLDNICSRDGMVHVVVWSLYVCLCFLHYHCRPSPDRMIDSSVSQSRYQGLQAHIQTQTFLPFRSITCSSSTSSATTNQTKWKSGCIIPDSRKHITSSKYISYGKKMKNQKSNIYRPRYRDSSFLFRFS